MAELTKGQEIAATVKANIASILQSTTVETTTKSNNIK